MILLKKIELKNIYLYNYINKYEFQEKFDI